MALRVSRPPLWALDAEGQPTQRKLQGRRTAQFITPIPKPKKQKRKAAQQQIVFDEGAGLSTEEQAYDPPPIINELRAEVDKWRRLPQSSWQVTAETGRLLYHWRHHAFSDIRPFFCQIEAIETAIWLTEVAPLGGRSGRRFLEHIANANREANPYLLRIAL